MTRPDARGQTTLDFAIGVSVFLAVIVFVFAFVPGILAPFTSASERHTVEVGRVADSLTQDALGSPKHPYVLDTTCTIDFFNGTASGPCGFTSDPLQNLNLDSGTEVNVTFLGNVSDDPGTVDVSDPLCWNDANENLTELGTGSDPWNDACTSSGDVPLRAGDTPPNENDATIAAFRVALLAGEDVTVKVVMW